MSIGTEPRPPELSGAVAQAFAQPEAARWPSLLQIEQADPHTPWLRWAQVRVLRTMGRLVEAETRARRVMASASAVLSIAERRRVLLEWGWCLSALDQPDQAYQVAREALVEGRDQWQGTAIDPHEESRIAWAIARFATQGGDEDEGTVWLRSALTADPSLYPEMGGDPVLESLTSPPTLPLLERLRSPLLCLVADGLADGLRQMSADNVRVLLSTAAGLIWIGRYSTAHGMQHTIPEVLRKGAEFAGAGLVDQLVSKRTRVPVERLWPALHVRAHLPDLDLTRTDEAIAGRRPPEPNPDDAWVQAVIEWWPQR